MSEPTSEEIADVLDGAADVLLERGWHQGGYEAPSGAVCIAGAISVALGGEPQVSPGRISFVRMFTEPLHDVVSAPGVARWNDALGRTEDDVHDLLRNTAKRLREIPAPSGES